MLSDAKSKGSYGVANIDNPTGSRVIRLFSWHGDRVARATALFSRAGLTSAQVAPSTRLPGPVADVHADPLDVLDCQLSTMHTNIARPFKYAEQDLVHSISTKAGSKTSQFVIMIDDRSPKSQY